MIIPVRCYTCGKVICDKWEAYVELMRSTDNSDAGDARALEVSVDVPIRTARGAVLDKLGIKRICCRRHFLGNVDLMELI